MMIIHNSLYRVVTQMHCACDYSAIVAPISRACTVLECYKSRVAQCNCDRNGMPSYHGWTIAGVHTIFSDRDQTTHLDAL